MKKMKVGKYLILSLHEKRSKGNGGQTSNEKVDYRHRKTQQRPNPKSLLGDKVDSGIGLRSTLA
jgi:hypothetical protein